MKKRTAMTAVALSTAMIFGVAPAHAEDAPQSTVSAPTDSAPSETNSENSAETPARSSSSEGEGSGNSSGSSNDDTSEDPARDDNIGSSGYSKNGASSNPAPEGPFNNETSSFLNRYLAYSESEEWQFFSTIIAAVAGLFTVVVELLSVYVSTVPGAKEKVGGVVNGLLPK